MKYLSRYICYLEIGGLYDGTLGGGNNPKGIHKGRIYYIKRCQTISATVTHALSNGKVKAVLYSTAGQFAELSSLFQVLARPFLFVPLLGTHFLLFAYCFWLSVLSHRSENGGKDAKWHKKRRDRNSRIARTAEIGTDGSATGRWHFFVITKATAGRKHKKIVLLKPKPHCNFILPSKLDPLKGQRITRLRRLRG